MSCDKPKKVFVDKLTGNALMMELMVGKEMARMGFLAKAYHAVRLKYEASVSGSKTCKHPNLLRSMKCLKIL